MARRNHTFIGNSMEKSCQVCVVEHENNLNLKFFFLLDVNPKYSSHFLHTDDGLRIKNVWRHHAGEYTCRAIQSSSTFSSTEEQTITLDVQCECISLFRFFCVLPAGTSLFLFANNLLKLKVTFRY
jgi:hypothetical protein